MVHAAGILPNQPSVNRIVPLDLTGTVYVLGAFGESIGKVGSGIVFASQAGHVGEGVSRVGTRPCLQNSFQQQIILHDQGTGNFAEGLHSRKVRQRFAHSRRGCHLGKAWCSSALRRFWNHLSFSRSPVMAGPNAQRCQNVLEKSAAK